MNQRDSLQKDFYEETISISPRDLEQFAEISGDYNPLHFDEKFAMSQGFANRIVHGALVISKVSGIIASRFPGAGTIIGSIDWKFVLPVLVNQDLKLEFNLIRTNTRKAALELAVLDYDGNLVQEARMIVFLGK